MSTTAALDAPAALLAVDWGTSSLRGARLDVHGHLLEQRAFPRGILSVSPGGFGEVFEACFGDWARQGATHETTQRDTSGTDRGDAPAPMHCLISGMAGSKQGWVEAPYCACPAGFADVAAQLCWIDDPALPLPTAIVPGLCCSHPSAVAGLDDVPDVMRGEEVQILGAMHLGGWRDGVCILPGTHSKWAWVVDGQVRSFRSYMTGEFYALLSQQSLLARTLDTQSPFEPQAFHLGVARARESGSLLHDAFGARTLSLFGRMQPGPLASYLSGLVIGEELRGLDALETPRITLIGSDALTARYALACTAMGVATQTMGTEATWAGLHALSHHLPLPAA